jgi:ABC-type multidrug transport system fused ATPase/permease subunit
MMDEATASVDPDTDSFIQGVIRDKFADCTVLTIAHRLHTVMDSDYVLVMDGGRTAEFEKPHTLLQVRFKPMHACRMHGIPCIPLKMNAYAHAHHNAP